MADESEARSESMPGGAAIIPDEYSEVAAFYMVSLLDELRRSERRSRLVVVLAVAVTVLNLIVVIVVAVPDSVRSLAWLDSSFAAGLAGVVSGIGAVLASYFVTSRAESRNAEALAHLALSTWNAYRRQVNVAGGPTATSATDDGEARPR